MGIFRDIFEKSRRPGLLIKALEPSLVLAVFFLDRLTKTLTIKQLYFKSEAVLPFFKLTYVENTGVAFGMFRNSNTFFIVFSVVLIAAILIFRLRSPVGGLAARAGLALVLGGALGNLCDRLTYGFVIDFLDLSFFPAVFNIADSAITVGAVLLAVGLKGEDAKTSSASDTRGGRL